MSVGSVVAVGSVKLIFLKWSLFNMPCKGRKHGALSVHLPGLLCAIGLNSRNHEKVIYNQPGTLYAYGYMVIYSSIMLVYMVVMYYKKAASIFKCQNGILIILLLLYVYIRNVCTWISV